MGKQHLNAGNTIEEYEEIEEIMDSLETSLIWLGVSAVIAVLIVSFAVAMIWF